MPIIFLIRGEGYSADFVMSTVNTDADPDHGQGDAHGQSSMMMSTGATVVNQNGKLVFSFVQFTSCRTSL